MITDRILCRMLLLVSVLVVCLRPAMAESEKAGPAAIALPRSALAPNGTLRVPAMELPVSPYLSAEAGQAAPAVFAFEPPAAGAVDVATRRESFRRYFAPHLKRMRERYPVQIEQRSVAGLNTLVITADGAVAKNNDRVLINLHGGAFAIGEAASAGLLESIPVAVLSGIPVISVDYRMGPEHQFPAASEDVANVYRTLLQRFSSKNIGIFGCSAGGLLTAQAVAWFQQEKLPVPGAIGILCASADARFAGDSYFIAPAATGQRIPTPQSASYLAMNEYFADRDRTDPLISPLLSPQRLAAFPPTLLLSATRAVELSSAVQTHRELVKAGVDAELYLWDGLWHAFLMDPDLPESREAYQVIANFFSRHLGDRSRP